VVLTYDDAVANLHLQYTGHDVHVQSVIPTTPCYEHPPPPQYNGVA